MEPVTQALSVETVIGADGGVASAKQNTPAPAPSLKGLPLSVTHSAMFGGVTLADITIYGPVSDTGDAGKQLTPILSINSPGSGPAVSLSCVLTTPVKVGVSSLCCATVPSFLKEIDALLAPITVNCEDNQIIDAIHAVTRLVTSTVAQHAVMCSRHDDRSGVHEPSLSQKSVLEELRVGRSVGRVRATASSTIPATVWRVLSAGSLGDLPDSLLSSLSPLFVLGSLHLSEICLVLTLHATRPVFIGVDNMTFTMSPVVLSHVCASGSHLLRELLAQLIADAVLSSPSLVGSLEVLGNPTGLLRSFGAGVYDLFALPLASLDKGRGGVVKGVAAGWKSLFTHVSEAALHSVSGIAGTLSRNLDRVSYDEAQVREREAARRRHAGLSASVAAGFRVLSSDVLSAAVGVVSDPFKVAAASGWGVTSFVKGMGRGLLGAVTKPVSGALDLVSQTSTGILNSSGLNTSPERRRASRTLTSHVNAQLLLRWRLLPPEFVYIGHFEGDIMVTEPLHDMFGCLFTCTIVMTTTALLILPPTKVGTPRRHPAVHSRVPLPQLLGSRVPGVPLTDIVSVEDGQTVRELLTLRCVRDGSHEYSVKFMIDGGEKRALCAQLRAATTLKPFP